MRNRNGVMRVTAKPLEKLLFFSPEVWTPTWIFRVCRRPTERYRLIKKDRKKHGEREGKSETERHDERHNGAISRKSYPEISRKVPGAKHRAGPATPSRMTCRTTWGPEKRDQTWSRYCGCWIKPQSSVLRSLLGAWSRNCQIFLGLPRALWGLSRLPA